MALKHCFAGNVSSWVSYDVSPPYAGLFIWRHLSKHKKLLVSCLTSKGSSLKVEWKRRLNRSNLASYNFIFHTLLYFPSCHWCLFCSNDVRHRHAAVPRRGLCWVSGPRTTPGLYPGHPTSAFTGILAECPGQPLLGLRLRLRLGLRACSVRGARWVLYTRLAVVTLMLMLLLNSTSTSSQPCMQNLVSRMWGKLLLCHYCDHVSRITIFRRTQTSKIFF